jgi:hypothetical protein
MTTVSKEKGRPNVKRPRRLPDSAKNRLLQRGIVSRFRTSVAKVNPILGSFYSTTALDGIDKSH